jgi:hypothetical protein
MKFISGMLAKFLVVLVFAWIATGALENLTNGTLMRNASNVADVWVVLMAVHYSVNTLSKGGFDA